jgi:hypothetical protein
MPVSLPASILSLLLICGELVARSVNGTRVLNMLHLAQLVVEAAAGAGSASTSSNDGSSDEEEEAPAAGASASTASGAAGAADTLSAAGSASYLRLEFTDGAVIVVDAATARSDTIAALSAYGITHAMSGRLRAALGSAEQGPCMWPFEPESAGSSRQALQKRQQRRRLALRR